MCVIYKEEVNMYFDQKNQQENINSKLGYKFKDNNLWQRAITRKSGLQEGYQDKNIGHNETLATLGDGILRSVIDDILMETNPKFEKGELSPERDKLVNNNVLSQIAEKFLLESIIIMGKGEKNNFQGTGKAKILAACFEAIIGAIFLDSNRDFIFIKKIIIQYWKLQEKYHQLLVTAILTEDVNRVEYLLALGIDPNITGSTAIYLCNFNDDDENAKTMILLAGGYEWATALQLALMSKRHKSDKFKQPVKPGTDPGIQGIVTKNKLQILPEKPEAIPNDIDLEGLLALLKPLVFENCSVQLARNLTLPKVHPGVQKLKLLFSSEVSSNCLKIIKLLLSYGANPNAKAWWGETALHTAAWLGNLDAIKLLIEYGADLSIVNKEGKTPAEIAQDKTVANLLSGKSNAQRKNVESVEKLSKSWFLKHTGIRIDFSLPVVDKAASDYQKNKFI